MMQYNWHRSPHRPAYLYTHWAPSKYRLSLFLYKGHSRHSQRKSDTVIITLIFEARKWVINYLFDFSVMGKKTSLQQVESIGSLSLTEKLVAINFLIFLRTWDHWKLVWSSIQKRAVLSLLYRGGLDFRNIKLRDRQVS